MSSRIKAWLMVGCGAFNVVNAGFVGGLGHRTPALVDLAMAVWCFGWGCYWTLGLDESAK